MPCGCEASCTAMCKQIGQSCCGGGAGGGCSCGSPASCPACQLHPGAGAYHKCGGSTPACPFCLTGWDFCSPACKPVGTTPRCPKQPSSMGNTTAVPDCLFQNNGAPEATNCALVCAMTSDPTKCKSGGSSALCKNDGCPTGMLCYPIGMSAEGEDARGGGALSVADPLPAPCKDPKLCGACLWPSA